MNELQKLYDELAGILVKTAPVYRDLTIKQFCEQHNISLDKPKHRRFKKKLLTQLPFDEKESE